jgi:hypothetical protein
MSNIKVLIIVAIVVLFCFLSMNMTKESFKSVQYPGSTPYVSAANLDEFYEGSTKGIEDYLVDNMTCHPSCCGTQWPVPFDGLTSNEVESCIETRGTPGPFVRTNYTCANGINGVGCPCITKKAYAFIANHGREPRPSDLAKIEPTFLIRKNVEPNNPYLSPYEEIQSKRSMFTDGRRLSDLELQRPETDLSNVQSYQSSIQPKYKQLEKTY